MNSHQQFTNFAGYFPLQHHDTTFEAHARILPHGHRVPVLQNGEGFYIDSLTEGLLTGWHLVDTKDNEKHPRLWVQVAPAVVEGTSWIANRDTWDSPDDRLKAMAAESPFGLKYPEGYPGVVVSGTELDSQNQLAAPAWAGIVAPSFSGPLELASAVWDVVGGKLSENYAPVTSSWRIYNRPKGGLFGSADVKYLGLAWELGHGGTDLAESIAGLGMVGEHGLGRSVLAAACHKAGGPLEVGSPNDFHKIGTDPASGEPINALHLSTYTLFQRPDGSGDSSLEDGGRYRRVFPAPLTTPAWWRHDNEAFHAWTLGAGPGLWRWQASSFIAAIPEPTDKLDPPPGGGGGKVSGPTEPVEIPPDNFGFPKPGPLPPEIFVTEMLPRAQKGNRRQAGTAGEISVRGLVFRESLDWKNYHDNKWAIDPRNQLEELSRESTEDWIGAASLVRMDVAADPSTKVKSTNNRYASIASGITWFLPAELGLEDIVDANRNGSNPLIDYTTIGKRWIGFGRGVNLFFGNASTNGPWERGQGFALEFNPAGTTFKMSSVTSSGAATDIFTMLSGGALTVLSSVSSPIVNASNYLDTDEVKLSSEAKSLSLIQKSGTWSSPKTQEFQDSDGTVALVETTQRKITCASSAGSFTAQAWYSYFHNSSGGSGEMTLPPSGSCEDGTEISIVGDADTDAHNITIVADGSDTINGASSKILTAEYESATLRLCGTEWRIF